MLSGIPALFRYSPSSFDEPTPHPSGVWPEVCHAWACKCLSQTNWAATMCSREGDP